jgi:hypothetical protein
MRVGSDLEAHLGRNMEQHAPAETLLGRVVLSLLVMHGGAEVETETDKEPVKQHTDDRRRLRALRQAGRGDP